jgi:hypothetical protein
MRVPRLWCDRGSDGVCGVLATCGQASPGLPKTIARDDELVQHDQHRETCNVQQARGSWAGEGCQKLPAFFLSFFVPRFFHNCRTLVSASAWAESYTRNVRVIMTSEEPVHTRPHARCCCKDTGTCMAAQSKTHWDRVHMHQTRGWRVIVSQQKKHLTFLVRC